MRIILLTNKYSGGALEIVQQEIPEGFEMKFLAEQTQEALENQISDADYLLAGGRLKITKAVLNNAKKLKMIQRSGVGLDALDLDAIKAADIPLYVNQGVNAESVAEHTLLLILACLRRLTEIDYNTKNGVWKKQEQGVKTYELRGKTVGIIGMGNIAKTLVKLLQPFGVTILYNSHSQAPHDFEENNHMRYVGMEELFQHSDIISIHCPLTDQTRNLINENTISLMKDGAVIVNTARGEIVNTKDLVSGLDSGKVAFAGLDVHECEPIVADNPIISANHVILTPHIAGVTADSFRAMMHDAFRNISFFDKGEIEQIAPYRYL